MGMLLEKERIEEMLNSKRVKYSYSKEQAKELRRLALEKYGAEMIALLDSNEIEELFKGDNLVPVTICGYANDTVFLLKTDVLANSEVVTSVSAQSEL